MPSYILLTMNNLLRNLESYKEFKIDEYDIQLSQLVLT